MDEPESCMSIWEIEQTAKTRQGDYERWADMIGAAYHAGATDVHNAWADGKGQSAADFGEATSDYIEHVRPAIEALTRPAPDSVALVKAGLEAAAKVADELGGVRARNLENDQFRAQHVRAHTIAAAIRALDPAAIAGLGVDGPPIQTD